MHDFLLDCTTEQKDALCVCQAAVLANLLLSWLHVLDAACCLHNSPLPAGFAEHMVGPLNHIARQRPSPHHRHAIRWGIMAGCTCTIVYSCFKHHWRRQGRRHRKEQHKQQLPGIASQLSQLTAEADTVPNPLLQGRLALAVHTTDVVATDTSSASSTDWIQNVPWSDWQIDQQDIRICQRPDGRLWELGSGASAKVNG